MQPIAGEVWRAHPTLDGVDVSNMGRVISAGHKRRSFGWMTKDGYKRTQVRTGHLKYLDKPMHHLVVEAFYREVRDGEHVDHLDGNKCNNCATNLQICSAQINIVRRHGYRFLAWQDGQTIKDGIRLRSTKHGQLVTGIPREVLRWAFRKMHKLHVNGWNLQPVEGRHDDENTCGAHGDDTEADLDVSSNDEVNDALTESSEATASDSTISEPSYELAREVEPQAPVSPKSSVIDSPTTDLSQRTDGSDQSVATTATQP